MPKRWHACLRAHYGRLMLELCNGAKWEFQFETVHDLQIAYDCFSKRFNSITETEFTWNERKNRFQKSPRRPLDH